MVTRMGSRRQFEFTTSCTQDKERKGTCSVATLRMLQLFLLMQDRVTICNDADEKEKKIH